jgi:hypothetical protein
MLVISSKTRTPPCADPAVAKILGEVSSDRLRTFVRMLAFPRHYFAENRANRQARDLILKVVTGFGYKPSLQGDFDNIVITSAGPADGPFLLLGAHYVDGYLGVSQSTLPPRLRHAGHARLRFHGRSCEAGPGQGGFPAYLQLEAMNIGCSTPCSEITRTVSCRHVADAINRAASVRGRPTRFDTGAGTDV